ncbi:uncharacterized protein ACR2FA_010190 [Aphomia sociella]
MTLDIEEIPPWLMDLIKNIIKKEDIETYFIEYRKFDSETKNYLGTIEEIDIISKTDESKQVNLLIKSPIEGDNTAFLSMSDIYSREVYFYNDLAKIFIELQNKANIPYDDRFKIVNSYEDSNVNGIILENMCIKGYNTYSRMDIVSLEFAERSIEQLARFHGMSFVLQQKNPECFEKKIKSLDPPFNFDKDWVNYLKRMFSIVLDNAKCDLKSKSKKTILSACEKYELFFKNHSAVMCLTHGDYRANNVLMKVKDGKILDAIPIDYQMICYGCPILDILYFIFSGTDRKFRKKHLSHLKDVYHNSLTRFLKFFDIDVENVFSRQLFEDMWKEKLFYGLSCFTVITPFLFATKENLVDLTQRDLLDFEGNIDECFKKRARGVVDDYIEWGYL